MLVLPQDEATTKPQSPRLLRAIEQKPGRQLPGRLREAKEKTRLQVPRGSG